MDFKEIAMSIRLIAVLVVCLCWGIAGTAQDKSKDDTHRIQGTWDWDPAEAQSDAEPQVILERVVIKGNKLTFHYQLGDQRFTSTTEFKLNPQKGPKEIDFTPLEGANKGKTYLGLYEIMKGRLKICYRGPGSTRPKDFDDKVEGNNGTAFVHLVANRNR
jgi:uncharacterized protein (TIGR03067 family)